MVKSLKVLPRAKSEALFTNDLIVENVSGSKSHDSVLVRLINCCSRNGIEVILAQDEHHAHLLHFDFSEFFKVGLKRSKRKDIVLLPNDLLQADDEVEE